MLFCLVNGMKLDFHHWDGLGWQKDAKLLPSPKFHNNILLVIQEYVSFTSNNFIRSITVRLLEPGHWFFFFCKLSNKIQGSTIQQLKILKPFELI